jgi:hypothetical protein
MPQWERGNICKGIAPPRMHSWASFQNRLSAMPRKRQFEGSFHEQFLMDFQWLNPLNREWENANSMS